MNNSPPLQNAHLIDSQCNILLTCPNTLAWAHRLGQTDIIGKNLFTVFAGLLHDSAVMEYEQVFRTGNSHLSTQTVTFDGKAITTNTQKIPMLKNGKTLQVLTLVHNITEQAEREKATLQTQKLDSLGVLAGGIAHDFNNLLGGIFGNLNLARKHTYTTDPKLLQYLDRAMTAFDRARHLTHQLLTFSKNGAPVRKSISLRPICHEAMELALSGSSIQCRLVLSDTLPNIHADANQIRQVLTNLLLNARQAMPVGGRVSIEADPCDIHSGNKNNLEPGKYVKICVCDNGPGIDADNLERVFDPFFSTKNIGSGLGLAIAHSVISQHGGSISIQSTPESGTRAAFFLRTFTTAASGARPLPVGKRISSKRVLLLEDDDLLQAVTGELLLSMGWDVEVVDTGEAAVSRFTEAEKGSSPFGLVIFDLTIEGGMGGQEAMAQLRNQFPHICGIVSSGYADSPVLSAPEEFGFCAKLVKPFQPNELQQVLEKITKQSGTI